MDTPQVLLDHHLKTLRLVNGICWAGVTLLWLRGVDLNHRPLGYEPNELPDCSTPQFDDSNRVLERQTAAATFLYSLCCLRFTD